MNNGYNRDGRQMPRGDQPPRPVQRQPQGQPQRQMPGADPRMQNPRGNMQRPAGQSNSRMAQERRQMPPQNTRDPRAAQQRPTGQRPMAQGASSQQRTRALNDTHRKATREQMREDKRRRRKEARRLFLGRLAVYGIMLLVLAAVVIGMFAFVFYRTQDENESTVNFVEKYDGKTGISNEVSGDLAYRNDVLYVNFSSIADGCDMSVIIDSKNAKFVLPDDGDTSDSAGTGHEEYVMFVKDSREIVICGQDFRLSDAAVFSDGDVWVPGNFVSDYMNGITVDEDKAGGNVYITREREDASDEDGDAPLAEVSFKLKATTAPDPTEPPEDAEITGDMPEVRFTTDLSAYEKYMNPKNADEYLVLVNKTNSVDADYVPSDLVNIANTRDDGRATQRMREVAAKALDAMFIEMYAAGYTDVSVTSAYRSYEYQGQLYNNYVANSGQEAADTFSAKPGKSEHQTGLCADLHNLPSASTAFADEEAYEWLSENAWKFGFILRFPEDKTEITGYMYEPWHYRFVGRNAAWKIHSAGMCLEEYLKD